MTRGAAMATNANLIVVLHRPQRLANIGGVVRAMKNMGLARLRLVRPAEYDPAAITGIAHRSEDVLVGVGLFETLDAALADATFVVGMTARRRDGAQRVATPREIAPELLERAARGPVALLFGPEDNGLTSAELSRCHAAVTIPADPAYPSLNLAHAALLVAYELRMAEALPAPLPQGDPPATAAQLEALFAVAERALRAIEFFKSGQTESTLRALRALAHRAAPDAREAALLTAICREALAFLARHGIRRGDAAALPPAEECGETTPPRG